jgi:phosphate transport system substrate-binding protein
MNLNKTGTSGTTIGLVVVLIAVVVGAGAYIALNPGGGGTTTITATVATTNTVATTATVATTNTVSTTATATVVTTASSTLLPKATVAGAGGTLVFPLMSTWLYAFSLVQTNVQVNYASVGSGAGITDISKGTVNFGESDAPLTTAQYSALPSGSTLLTIPISASGVVPAYNLPGLPATTHLNFTGDVLAKIFLGQITAWNDPAIAALNPKITLPSNAIVVIHRSDGSGTMYAFTNYLTDSNAQWKSQVGTSTTPNWPVGTGCKGNEGVAGCVENNLYSLGPLEVAYVLTNSNLIGVSINYGEVRNHAGNFVLATLADITLAMQAGISQGAAVPTGSTPWTGWSIINNIYNDSADAGIYPITTFTYALIYESLSASYAGFTSQAQATATVSFLWYCVNQGQTAGANIGYAALPANVVASDKATLQLVTYNGVALLTGS